eukprot:scpid102146/ scgid30672/ 
MARDMYRAVSLLSPRREGALACPGPVEPEGRASEIPSVGVDIPAVIVVDVVAETVTPGVIPSFPDVVIEAGVVIDAAAVVGVVASAVATADVVVGVVTAEAAFVVTATATVGAVVGMVVGVVVG